MEIILIRHGKAEDRHGGKPDENRALTGEGCRRLEKSLPGYIHHIGQQKQILIWSSPLLRAKQTAEIIARGLHVPAKNIRQCNYLGNGDFNAFLDALASVEDSVCLIMVGHEPYLGEWSQQIGGTVLPFKKGAAAGFHLTSVSPLVAELLWFAQPDNLIHPGQQTSSPDRT